MLLFPWSEKFYIPDYPQREAEDQLRAKTVENGLRQLVDDEMLVESDMFPTYSCR
jgi:hypothetical protein